MLIFKSHSLSFMMTALILVVNISSPTSFQTRENISSEVHLKFKEEVRFLTVLSQDWWRYMNEQMICTQQVTFSVTVKTLSSQHLCCISPSILVSLHSQNDLSLNNNCSGVGVELWCGVIVSFVACHSVLCVSS